jgi:hypothetical protein
MGRMRYGTFGKNGSIQIPVHLVLRTREQDAP